MNQVILSALHGIIADAAIAVMVILSVCNQYKLLEKGSVCFRYFTILSNMFAALTVLVVLPFQVLTLIHGELLTPQWAETLQLVGTTGVAITFLTTVFFLAPRMGFKPMFDGPSLYMHGCVPILAILNTIFFGSHTLPFVATIFAVIPVVLYSILYAVNVMVKKKWPDFYGFTFGGKASVVPISLAVMYIAAYLIATGLWQLKNLLVR